MDEAGPILDEAALERLYSRLERPVYNVVYRWLWNPQDAQDVVQEAFVRLWGMRGRVRLETVEPLVYRIALNQAAKRRRWRRLRRFLHLDAGHEDPSELPDVMLARHARQAQVRAAVEALPEELRQVVTLCAFSGMSYARVAEVAGVPEGTVGSRRNRALAQLRTQLGDDDEA